MGKTSIFIIAATAAFTALAGTRITSIVTPISPTPIPTQTPTVTVTVTPSLTPTPTRKPTPQPTPTITPTPLPAYSSQQINEFIDRFAGQYNISPHILRHIAVCESGLNPAAQNLYYAGLYQFSASTWANYRRKMGEDPAPGLRFDPPSAVKTAAFVLSINQAYIWPNCVP